MPNNPFEALETIYENFSELAEIRDNYDGNELDFHDEYVAYFALSQAIIEKFGLDHDLDDLDLSENPSSNMHNISIKFNKIYEKIKVKSAYRTLAQFHSLSQDKLGSGFLSVFLQ